jgi:hypothetical protein
MEENSENFNNNSEANDNIETQNIISLNKFIFLSVASFGLYEIWWIYKAWKFYQQKEQVDIMPAARAIFSIFYLNSLFEKILEFAKEKDYEKKYSSISLFLGFIAGNLLTRLPDPFWLVSIFIFVFLIPPFQALNFAKQNSKDFIVIEQTSFSSRQIALIVVGVVFWILVILGMTMKDVNQ